jgi:hypothetical protein
MGILHTNGLYVAVGGDLGDDGANLSRSAVLTSMDGKNWMEHDPATTNSLAAMTFAGGRFSVVGRLGTTVLSSDATNWTALTAVTTNTLNSVAFGHGRSVAVGGDSTRATILSSPDGTNWTVEPNGNSSSTRYGVAFGQTLFVAVGRTNSGRRGTILTSSDDVHDLVWLTTK